MDKLTPQQVDRFLAARASAGLSRTYIGRMRTTLIDALRHAERRGIVPRNVASLYRHTIRPVADAALRMHAVLGG
jgi:hypothetical protein